MRYRHMRRLALGLLLTLHLALAGCVGAAIGLATDAAVEVAKIPFKVGGAVIDVVAGDDEEEDDD